MFRLSLILLAVLFVSGTRGAVEFNCTYAMIDVLTVGNLYHCHAQVTIVGESRNLESVEGTHENGKTNDDVAYIWIYKQYLPFVPENITSFFKNIKGLEWQNSNMAAISADDLKPFPNLLVFRAFGGNLVSIDGELFQHTKLLRLINFGSNQIQHIGHDLVKKLTYLQYLYFYFNPCIDAGATNRTANLLLNDQLPILCPPEGSLSTSTTTESPQECPKACADRIELSEVKISEQNEKILIQDALINGLNCKIRELAERLIELERKVRELASIP